MKKAAIQSYWTPQVFSELSCKRKIPCLPVHALPDSQAVLCARKERVSTLRLIVMIYIF